MIQSADEQIIDEVYTSILKLGDNRILEKYSHKDQLFEVMSLFKRVKIIIFSMILMISILLAFLVLNITKAALISNFKLIKMIQIMGESSYELAKNVSISIIKKIIPGSFLSILFVSFISSILIKIMGVNFYFLSDNLYIEQTIETLILLIIFMIFLLVSLLIFYYYIYIIF